MKAKSSPQIFDTSSKQKKCMQTAEMNNVAEEPASRAPLGNANTNVSRTQIKSRSSWLQFKPWGSLAKRSNLRSRKATNTEPRLPESPYSRFCVVIAASASCSFMSVLAQVSGGPLRSVHKVQEYPRPVILLEFISDLHAQVFREHVLSKRCLVRGSAVTLMRTPNEILHLLAPRDLSVTEDSSRRTIVLYKDVAQSSKGTLIRCSVDPALLMSKFSSVGQVVQVRPMLLRRQVAYAIDFTRSNDATTAIRLFEMEQRARGSGMAIEQNCLFEGLLHWRIDFYFDTTENQTLAC